ncbi:MAG TPA: phospholipase [Anaerolineae bacterium]|nr:phospholipase [Anaerolineae bacterium]
MPGVEILDPHAGTRTEIYGAPLEDARVAVILLHGRGATPEDILHLAHEVDPGGFTFLAPEAAGETWYPQSFSSPLEANQPYLDSALRRVAGLVTEIGEAGIPFERTVLAGFSQGACLALEYACRNARRYGGLVGLSGGLIGPDDLPRDYAGSLDGTPVFLGSSEADLFVPLQRVRLTGEILRSMGAEVEERIYPGMGHLVNQDELDAMGDLMRRLVGRP